MGRTSKNPKIHIVSCRINDQEMETLQTIASKSQISITNLLRQSLDLLEQEFAKSA